MDAHRPRSGGRGNRLLAFARNAERIAPLPFHLRCHHAWRGRKWMDAHPRSAERRCAPMGTRKSVNSNRGEGRGEASPFPPSLPKPENGERKGKTMKTIFLLTITLLAAFAFNAGIMWCCVELFGWNPAIIAGVVGMGHAANALVKKPK